MGKFQGDLKLGKPFEIRFAAAKTNKQASLVGRTWLGPSPKYPQAKLVPVAAGGAELIDSGKVPLDATALQIDIYPPPQGGKGELEVKQGQKVVSTPPIKGEDQWLFVLVSP